MLQVIGDSRLSGKCQVTIPKRVREVLNVKDGDLLVFVNDRGNICLKRGKVQIET
ncbi:MAG: AbrB/MazE/SpoVT family DNA-binding domain-containing protein [Candidatus Bathyarchaeia archaeon]